MVVLEGGTRVSMVRLEGGMMGVWTLLCWNRNMFMVRVEGGMRVFS